MTARESSMGRNNSQTYETTYSPAALLSKQNLNNSMKCVFCRLSHYSDKWSVF